MNKKDILEIKRRYTKEGHNFSNLCGCYVNEKKEKVLTFKENIYNLEDNDLFKYLEIAKKSLSGKLFDNLLPLSFSIEEKNPMQEMLLSLIKSNMDDNILNNLYDKIISNYESMNNYLILIFHDVYDIPLKTTDNISLSDSIDVHDYMILSICPVELSRPFLSYNRENKRFSSMNRDWIVKGVDCAFTYPAFSDRNTDIQEILLYNKDPKNPNTSFFENLLSINGKYTSTQKKIAFNNIVTTGLPEDKIDDTLLSIHKNISDYIELEKNDKDEEDIILEDNTLKDILKESGFNDDKIDNIKENLNSTLDEDKKACELLDNKLLKNSDLKLEKKALQEKVVSLSKELNELGLDEYDKDNNTIIIKTNDDIKDQIIPSFVDGERCLIIPLLDTNNAIINGEKIDLN